MKILKYFMSLVAAAGLVTSCSSDLDTVCVLSPENAVAPVLHDMGVSEITFTSKNLTETLEVEWDAADFGVDAAISYSLRAAYEGNEVVVLATSETKASVTYEALNQSLALAVEDGGLGVPADVPTEVAFRVAATVGSNYNLLYSATQNITVTTTSAEKTYDTYYVVGTLNGWDHATVAKEFDFLYNFAGDGNLYEGIVDLGDDYATAEFKFTKGAWGDGEHSMVDGQEEAEASSIALVAGGGGSNINLYKANRFYHFSLDLAGLTLKKNYSFNTIGVVGTINDWGGTPDVEMTYNASKRRFYADVEVAADGEVKFRADNTWGACEYGGADGTLQAGGANIPVAAGNYRFYIYLSNPSELTYEINADMFGKEEPTAQAPAEPEEPEQPAEKEPNRWGVFGSLNSWGGDNPDLYMDEIGDNLFLRSGLALTTTDEFKIRFNDEWNDERNYGLNEGDPAIEPNAEVALLNGGGSQNMKVAVDGTYDLYFNPVESKAWLMEQGKTPEIEIPSYKLYADVSATTWTEVYIWAWDAAGTNYSGGNWPGMALTQTEVDGKTLWVFDVPLELNGKSLNVIFSCGSEQTVDIADVPIDADHTITLTEIVDGKWQYTLDGEAVEVPPVVLGEHNWALCGDINGWGDTEMTAEDGWVVAKGVAFTDGQKFKVRADKSWNINYGLGEAPIAIDGSTFELKFNGGDMVIPAAGTYDIYFTIDANEVASMKIVTVEGGETPGTPETPETPEPSNGFKIYAYSEDGWTNMNLYGWITDPITASWPGTKMSVEKVNGLDFFVAQIPAEYNNVTINIIFNNGSEQINDITGVVVDKDLYFAVKGKSATQIDPATYTPAPPATSEASKLYLKPNMWNSDSPRFEAYFFGNGEKWVTMTPSEVSGAFECELPEGYPNVIFIRMDPNKPEHNWDSKWNQTSDLTIPTDGKNCYSVPQDVWDNADNSGWTTI